MFHMPPGKVPEGFRDTLTGLQLAHLTTAETATVRALQDGMAAGEPYKAVFQLAKARCERFAALIGKSVPGVALIAANDHGRLSA
ncbi:hypothetical protein EV683_11714 [Crenobacter luteus]|uniref:hypothetical protein n=1 Tax=Crenobacter luteus TaxID=1452487 RepID=UPI001047AD84|nr:hypothetical protein [Crenobacter luteus]TCP10895.1 hypothetical protein EV683_11714 [Crenobacter luteus]